MPLYRLSFFVFLFVFSFLLKNSYADQMKYNQHMSELKSAASKVESFDEEIKRLVRLKVGRTDPEQIVQITREIAEAAKKLEFYRKQYDKQMAIIKYQFPEKGSELEKKYKRKEAKTIEEYTSEISINDKLDKVQDTLVNQLEAPLPIRNLPDETKPDHVKKESEKREEKPVIIIK